MPAAARPIVAKARAVVGSLADVGGIQRRWLLLIGGLALLVRLRLLTANSSITGGDGPVYFHLAHELLSGHGLSGNGFRPPGYPIAILPAVLAGKLLGHGEADLLLAGQDVLGLLLVMAILVVGARFFGTAVGVAAGLLAAISPVLVTLERLTYPDLMFACAIFAATALLAEGLIRQGDSRWLMLAGVAFGVAAYLKPAAEPLIVAPLLALLIFTRSFRRALAGGAVAGGAMLLVMSPWLLHNAVHGTIGMSNQGGLTLFYRAFDEDGYRIPTDTRYGVMLRDLQVRHPSGPFDRLYARAANALEARGLTESQAFGVMQQAAVKAIERNLPTYLGHSARDLKRTVGDLTDSSLSEYDDFNHQGYLMHELAEARVAVPPDNMVQGVLKLGLWLSTAWLVVSLYGLAALALPFSRDRRVRAAGAAFLVTWLVAALGTVLSHGALWRYSAGLAPLTWLLGAAGAVAVWTWARTALTRRAAPERSIGRSVDPDSRSSEDPARASFGHAGPGRSEPDRLRGY